MNNYTTHFVCILRAGCYVWVAAGQKRIGTIYVYTEWNLPYRRVLPVSPVGSLLCLSEFFDLFQPSGYAGIAGHPPVAPWTDSHSSYFGSVGQAGTFELLTEKPAEEGM